VRRVAFAGPVLAAACLVAVWLVGDVADTVVPAFVVFPFATVAAGAGAYASARGRSSVGFVASALMVVALYFFVGLLFAEE
jgi:hypothetical protein